MTFHLYQGDAITLRPISDLRAKTIITSPPYFGLRSYGDEENEVGGNGQSLDDYLGVMAECAVSWLRHITYDGTLWLVMGDTASGSGGAGGDYNSGGSKVGKRKWRQGKTGLPAKTMCNAPNQVVEQFIRNGWLLRQTVVWAKPSAARADPAHERKPLTQHEYIFMLVPEAPNRKKLAYPYYHDRVPEARGSVWEMPVGRKAANGHPSPFPEELVRRCVLLSTDEGDIVLDPFCGSGTTPQVADRLGRQGIGVDLYRWWD
jgi:DNA modification methylase